MNYPKVEETEVDKYKDTLDIFGMAFLWLFSEGIGGLFEIRPKKKTLRTWMKECIYYK